MKVCVVQTKPFKGDIPRNILSHKRLIELAVSSGAEIIVFPELSITGYEPELAKELAIEPGDDILTDFQMISNKSRVTIGVGMPTKSNKGVCISMIFFQPNKPRQVYSKKYLHADEEPFFVSGENESSFIDDSNIALAICYELSIPEHAHEAYKSGAELYLVSAVKSRTGIGKALTRLSEIASEYSMPALLSNCVGISGGEDCAGKTSAWNDDGLLVGQLDDSKEGILIFDTATRKVTVHTI